MQIGGGTVLVVDHDSESLALMTRVLQQEGYQVQAADSGRLALISTASNPAELILLDIHMPDVDGFEVCRRIKATEAGRRIPVMFISASREMDDWVAGLAMGAVDFVYKPFHREELVARVRTHLELGRLQAELEVRVAQRTAELSNAIEQLQLEVLERRRAEQEARESEARFQQIANAAPVIIWTSGPDHRVNFRSEYAGKFAGRRIDELHGDGWFKVVHPEERESKRRSWSEAVAARTPFQLEFRARQADGEYRWMLDMATPRFLANGGFAGYVGIVIDYTEVKQSQERAFRAQNLENLRVLTAGIAHDFNTLIGAIFGEADLALSDIPPESPAFACVERIVSVARRSAEIVRLLMAYAGDKSESSATELVDLNSVIQEIVPHLKVSILRRAEIRTALAQRLPAILANPMQIRQVVLNVIMNAVEALEGETGIVTVSTSETGALPGSTGQLSDGRHVKIEVSDTGRGMTPEMLERIFDPYYSTKFLGRGLGLAAVQGIVRAHRGVITARSMPGNGSTFEVVLPSA